MVIGGETIDAIVEHAREDAPNECCGVLAADGERITAAHPVKNVFASPLRFELDPIQQFELTEEIEARGERMAGSYHSHTKSEAWPSQTDINQWDPWPELIHLICSIAAEKPVVRAFRIRDKQVHEIELEVQRK